MAYRDNGPAFLLPDRAVMLPPPENPMGPLRIDEVFIEYDGPQLFSCVDKIGTRFLVSHVPPSEQGDRWLYVSISPSRLKKLSSGRLDLRLAFAEPELGFAQIITFSPDGSVDVASVRAAELSDDLLPEAGEFLERDDLARRSLAPVAPPLAARASDNADEVQAIAAKLLAGRAPTPLWEFAPETLAFLRQMRTPVEIAASKTGRLIADLVLRPGKDRVDVPVPALGSFLLVVQRLVDALGEAPEAPTRGPIRAVTREWTRLDAVASFPSSFGLRIETHHGSAVPGTEGSIAFEKLVALMEAGGDPSRLRELLPRLGKRAALHYKSFAKSLQKTDVDLDVVVGLPWQPKPLTACLTKEQVDSVVQFLELESEPIEDTIQYTGRLIAINIKTKFFALEGDDRILSGRIADDCLPMVDKKKINEIYDATITVVTELKETTGEEVQKFILASIKDRAE